MAARRRRALYSSEFRRDRVPGRGEGIGGNGRVASACARLAEQLGCHGGLYATSASKLAAARATEVGARRVGAQNRAGKGAITAVAHPGDDGELGDVGEEP